MTAPVGTIALMAGEGKLELHEISVNAQLICGTSISIVEMVLLWLCMLLQCIILLIMHGRSFSINIMVVWKESLIFHFLVMLSFVDMPTSMRDIWCPPLLLRKNKHGLLLKRRFVREGVYL